MSKAIIVFFFVFFFFGCQMVEGQSNPTVAQLINNDIAAYSYAFAMEQVGIALYNFGSRTFERELYSKVNISFELVKLIETHTQLHATALRLAFVSEFGQQIPTPNCTYSFQSLNTFPKYLAAVISYESTAASTYYSLILTGYSKATIQTFASIATVKSKHTAYLSRALVDTPFPSTNQPISNLTDFTSPFAPSCPPVPAPRVLRAVPPSAFDTPSRNPVLQKRAETAFDAVNPSLAALTANDVESLKLTLALNSVELALLDYSLSRFTFANFIAGGYSAADFANLNILQRQLLTQNQQLTTLLRSQEYRPCSFNFAQITSVATFTSTAANLFDNSTAVLNGLLLRVYDKEFLSFVASLAGVSGKYASFFATLRSGAPFPRDLAEVSSPAAARSIVDAFATTCPDPLPSPKYYQVVPLETVVTPAPYQPTQGTCLVTDFLYDVPSWSSTHKVNFTSANSSLVVSNPPAGFFFLAPARYRGNLSAFYANGNGTVSVLYGAPATGSGAGLIIKGGNGFELVYQYPSVQSLYIASFGSGSWFIRPQGSNSTGTPATAADIVGVLTYVQCFLVKGSSNLKGFNLCDTAPQSGSDCANRCSGHGACTPNFPLGPTCSCFYGYSGANCATRVRSQTGRFKLPSKVITWNYGL
eukprot:TRINITY_DN1862_c0_g1_i2.p1 TRINITY_DN1862_c0_g1~~TRINITY_DN1862_c0_g1_i2.p1  ORF type:complete len:646 (-),score=200.68 TRINITY_DN1862_c0_g1_i2:88-2025(-)